MEHNQFELIIHLRLKLTYFVIILPMFMIHCELITGSITSKWFQIIFLWCRKMSNGEWDLSKPNTPMFKFSNPTDFFFIFGGGSGILNIEFRLVWIFENLGSAHSKGLYCVLVACNNGSGSYRKTMSNEGGHNCLNNENKINMEVWILNIEVWKLNIEVWILMSEYWILTVWILDTRNKIFRFHSRFILLNLLGNRSLRTKVKLSSK